MAQAAPGDRAPLTGAAVDVVSITAKDGDDGISTYNTGRIEVLGAAPPGHTYWLITHVFRSDGSPFVVKAQVRGAPGQESHDLQFNDVPGSTRDIVVVDADPTATDSLVENHRRQFEGSWDNNRLALPPGARIVSETCHVEKTRA